MRPVRTAVLLLLGLALAAPFAQAQIAYRAHSQASAANGSPAPTFQAAGTAVSGTGSVTPTWPAHLVNDVALLFCESAGGQAVTLSTPNGFAPVLNSPQFTGTGTSGTRISVFWARATSTSMPAPVVADPGDHVYCRILTYRGVATTGNPWDVTGGGVNNILSVTGVTTTVANTLVVQIVAREDDSAAAAFSAQTNANLTGIAERSDGGTTSGNGGGFAVWDGVKASAGPTGATTVTVTSSPHAFLTVALRPAGLSAPTFQAAGTAVSGTGSVTPTWPAHLVNDVALLACESAGGQAVTLSTPNGFAPVLNSPQFTGTGTSGTRISVFWARATSTSMPAPVVADPGDHVYCRILTYRGVATTGNPWDVTGGGVNTTITVTGVTTTVPNTRVVQVVARDNDSAAAAFSAQTNANLTGIAERSDGGTTSGNGGGFAVWDGVKASAGATGNTTATASPVLNAFLTIALRPPDSTLTINVPPGTLPNDVMIASIAFGPCSGTSGGACTTTITPPAGWTQVNSVTDQTGGGNFGNRLYVYRRVATGAEPASYTWTFGGTPAHTGAAGGIISFSGVDTTNPIVAQAGQATASSTSHAAPSINTGTVTNTMLVSTHSANSSAAWTPPGGMTERVDAASLAVPNGAGISIQMNHELFTGSGATGTRTANWTAPPTADTGVTHMLALRPAVTLNHFSISHAGSGVACDDQPITITAHNAAHNPVSAGGLTVTLSTTNGKGTWTGIIAGGGTLSDPTPGDGSATYTFAPGSSSVTLAFRYANLTATSETFGFNVSGGGFSETSGTATAADDPPFTMAQAGFQFRNVTDGTTTIPTQIAGKPSNAGFGAKTIRLRAVRTDTATGNCVALFANQTRTVQLGAECNNPAACAGQQVSINGASIATSNDNGTNGAAAYTGVSLSFNAASEADTVILYPDAGQISLHARYDLDSGVPGFEMTGSSNPFVVRPFGLRVSGVTTSASPSPSDPAPYVAGQNFNVTLTAVAWKTGDDADSDGVPDSDAQITTNPATPNFGQEATPAQATLTHSLNAPAGGSAGTLGGATTFTGFSGGTKTQAVNWSEVGFINLHAASANYLGSGQNVTNSADGRTGVGRFRPAHFALSGASLANRTDKTCAPASTFTYLGEEFGLSFTLQARNSGGAVTQNYTGAYAKLALGVFANYNLGVRSGATGLTPRLSGLNATGSWSNGSAAVELRALVSRAASPEPPFNNVEYGIAPVDSDSVAMNTLDFDADVNGTPERKKLDGVAGELRYGRIRLGNANGSELLDLPVPMRLEYYAGASGWQKNTADTCSAVQASDFAFAFPADPKNQLAACETRAIVAGTPPNQTLTLEKPGAGNHGWTDLVLNLGTTASGNRCTTIGGPGPAATTANMPYLQFKWKNPTDENPSARASFGMQPSAGPVIYRRERY